MSDEGFSIDVVSDRILRAIRQIVRQISEHSNYLSRDSGLTLPQLLCIRAIGVGQDAGGLTVGDVARRVHLSAGTVSRIIDRLVIRDLVDRQRGTVDRRKVRLTLTDLGVERFRTLPNLLQIDFLTRLAALPADEQRAILNALERVVDLMEATGLDASPLLAPGSKIDP